MSYGVGRERLRGKRVRERTRSCTLGVHARMLKYRPIRELCQIPSRVGPKSASHPFRPHFQESCLAQCNARGCSEATLSTAGQTYVSSPESSRTHMKCFPAASAGTRRTLANIRASTRIVLRMQGGRLPCAIRLPAKGPSTGRHPFTQNPFSTRYATARADRRGRWRELLRMIACKTQKTHGIS